MNQPKPRFRYDHSRIEWRSVSYPGKRVCQCEICGGPAVKQSKSTLCMLCSRARSLEINKQRRVFINALRSGKIGSAAGRQCVDCAPDIVTFKKPATEWEHRDWREPLKVVPICRMHNARRGRAMTAYEASFSQRTNDAPKPLHVDPICQPHQRVSDESVGARQSLPT